MAKRSIDITLAGLKVDKTSKAPLAQQVYDMFRKLILEQRLLPGERLPATRNLATELNISRAMITQGFEQLILEGYLVGKPGSGTYVAAQIPDRLTTSSSGSKKKANTDIAFEAAVNLESISEEVLMRNCEKEEITPFQTGAPALDIFPYKIWFRVAQHEIKELKSYHLGYGDAAGYEPLRREITKYLRIARAVKCDAEQIIIVNGSQQGINITAQCLLKKDEVIWMEDPGYHGAKFASSQTGAKICPIPLQNDGMDVDYAIKNFGKARMVYLTPSHQFPLGGTLSLQKRLQLLEWAAKNKVWIVEDDYDSEFRYQGRPLASLQGLDTNGIVIYMGTFSKVLFPGLRLAYLVLPGMEMLDKFKKTKAMVDRQSPILDQIILTKFMQDGHFLRHIRKMRLLYSERQKMLINLVNEQLSNYLEIIPSDAGMNLIAFFKRPMKLKKFREEAKNQKLVVPLINDYALQHFVRPGIMLGYTAFTKYKMKVGIEKLTRCILAAL